MVITWAEAVLQYSILSLAEGEAGGNGAVIRECLHLWVSPNSFRIHVNVIGSFSLAFNLPTSGSLTLDLSEENQGK